MVPPKADAPASRAKAIQVCVMYATTSICISLMYKTVLSSYSFNGKFIMLSCQLAIALAFCLFARRFLYRVPGLEIPAFDWATLRQSLPVGILFVFNIAIGWFGLALVDVPMFLCIRRTTTFFTMLFEYIILHTVPKTGVQVAVGIILVGTVMAGWETLSRDLLGYAFTIGNNILTALYLNISRRFSDETGTRGFGLVYYNSIVALPLAITIAVLRGEFQELAEYPQLWDPGFFGTLFFSSALGVFMTYAVFLCNTVNSPLATSITGNLKDVISTLLGGLLFGFDVTALKIMGLVVSFFGGGLFAYLRLVEKEVVPPPVSLSAVKFGGNDERENGDGTGGEIDSDQEKGMVRAAENEPSAVEMGRYERSGSDGGSSQPWSDEQEVVSTQAPIRGRLSESQRRGRHES